MMSTVNNKYKTVMCKHFEDSNILLYQLVFTIFKLVNVTLEISAISLTDLKTFDKLTM